MRDCEGLFSSVVALEGFGSWRLRCSEKVFEYDGSVRLLESFPKHSLSQRMLLKGFKPTNYKEHKQEQDGMRRYRSIVPDAGAPFVPSPSVPSTMVRLWSCLGTFVENKSDQGVRKAG